MKLIEIIKEQNVKNIIFDFDNTITTSNSQTSIGDFSNYLNKEYKQKKKIIDQKVNNTSNSEILHELWYAKIKLLKEYYYEEVLPLMLKDFEIRKEFYNIYDYCINNDIKIIICSSGFKPLINYILKNNNIIKYKIFANDLNTEYKDIIHPNNKNNVTKNIKDNIVVGDDIKDLSMANVYTKKTVGINIKDEVSKLSFDYNID